MRIACLQHASFEGPGKIAAWFQGRGHTIGTAHLYRNEPLPDPADFDLLLVMGGPMSVNDESEFPWLAPEKQLIRDCLAQNKFVLGICLGSQLIASALGARIYRNRVKEIGWFPVRLRETASASFCFARLPKQLEALHWHGETYDLPPNCTHLAESDACAIQAFEHPSALALQFHLEATKETLEDFLRHGKNDIGAGPYEQSPGQLIAGEVAHGEAAGAALCTILEAIEARH
jgi:GMP synthase-like glutamine amidotransferase